MSGINDDVREIIGELDADGGGFQTAEAANLLVYRYVAVGICQPDGTPKPKVQGLMRMGASVAVKNYNAGAATNERLRNRAAAISGGVQGDFQHIAEDFDHRWVMAYVALEETEHAERKLLIRMTLPEVLAVIALKRKKAAEGTAEADRLQDIVDNNPHWYETPSLTIADILDIHEPDA